MHGSNWDYGQQVVDSFKDVLRSWLWKEAGQPPNVTNSLVYGTMYCLNID